MSKLNYVEWDIEDIGGHYEFTPQEMMSTDYLDMINLLKRGSGEVTYTFNCDSSIPKGTTITVRNNEFGADKNGNFFGIQILLNPDTTAPRSSYWFFFQDQVESFTFNGVFWKCNSPEPKAIAQMSFIDDETMPSGYLDISAYNEELKKILFSNVNMNNFDPSILITTNTQTQEQYGTFFRPTTDANIGILEQSGIKSHGHETVPHSHDFPNNNYNFASQKADTTGKHHKHKSLLPNTPDSNGKYPYSAPGSTESITMTGKGTKTIPKNISGRYVIKCF